MDTIALRIGAAMLTVLPLPLEIQARVCLLCPLPREEEEGASGWNTDMCRGRSGAVHGWALNVTWDGCTRYICEFLWEGRVSFGPAG